MKPVTEQFIAQAFGLGEAPVELYRGNEDDVNRAYESKDGAHRIEANNWLPFAAKEYNLSTDISDYVLVPVPVMFTELPNTNGDSVTLKEFLRFDTEMGQQAFKTFRGKGCYLEHCFPGNTPILTRTGYRRIDKIKLGDEVLTHKGRYRKVTQLFDNGVKPVSNIICQGMGGTIQATKNHPFFVVDRRQLYGKLRTGGKSERALRKDAISSVQPHFRAVEDIYTGDYLVVPINIGGKLCVEDDFAFLTGVYAAEGSFNKSKTTGKRSSTVLTIGYHEDGFLEKVLCCLDNLGLEYAVYPRPARGTNTVWIKGADFANRMYSLVGEYCHLKHAKNELRSWNKRALKNFLGGYISGDGHVGAKTKRIRCVTVSKQLAYDIQNIFAYLGAPASIGKNMTKDSVMRGPKTEFASSQRHYLRRDTYVIGASASAAEHLNKYIVGKDAVEALSSGFKTTSRMVIVGKYLLAPVISMKHGVEKKHVYNFEVDEDHSYVASNAIVHNCNKDPRKAKGVILDVFLRPLKKFGDGKYFKLVELMAYDRTKDPLLVNSILNGENNAYSVGFYFKSYTCSVCGQHVQQGAPACTHTFPRRPTLRNESGKLVYRQCHTITGFETSVVANPSYVVAVGPHLMDASML